MLIPEARLQKNMNSVRHESPEINEFMRGSLALQTANRVCCRVVSGLEFRIPQGFCIKEGVIYNGTWLKVIHHIISFGP